MTPDPQTMMLRYGSGLLWVQTESGALAFDRHVAEPFECDEQEAAILEVFTQPKPAAELATKMGIDLAGMMKFATQLSEWSPLSLSWQSADQTIARADHERELEALRLRDTAAAMSADENENADFHNQRLDQAERQFDEIETTISHVFREPHPALEGKTYGETFCDWLAKTGRLKPGVQIVEIGCGLGYFAKAILDRLSRAYPDIYRTISYTMIDLSTELQKAQQRNCAEHLDRIAIVHGNIEKHDFGGRQFDLLLSNEVVADLSVAVVTLENIEAGKPQTAAERLVLEYGLKCVPVSVGSARKAVVNIGAIRLVENSAKALARGGHAVISEYGTQGQSPKAVHLGNHTEFTVDFAHLQQVAERQGAQTVRANMGDLFAFDSACETLELECLTTLNTRIMPYLTRDPIPVLAYTPSMLERALGDLRERISNLSFQPLDHPNAFSPFRFEVLALSNPLQ